MHDASCNLKNIQLHNATITYEGIEPFKLLIVTQVSYKRFNKNNTYMIQATLQSKMPSHKKIRVCNLQKLDLIVVGFNFKTPSNHWVVDTKTQVKDSPTFAIDQNWQIESF
jgi:hypothetical protein